MTLLGIEIGGSKLQLVLGDEAGHIGERRRLLVDRAHGAAGIRRQIEQTIPELLSSGKVEAVGVGFGGPVDYPTQQVVLSTHVGGWQEFDLPGWLKGTFGVPVLMDNDANVGALGEGLHGAEIGRAHV